LALKRSAAMPALLPLSGAEQTCLMERQTDVDDPEHRPHCLPFDPMKMW